KLEVCSIRVPLRSERAGNCDNYCQHQSHGHQNEGAYPYFLSPVVHTVLSPLPSVSSSSDAASSLDSGSGTRFRNCRTRGCVLVRISSLSPIATMLPRSSNTIRSAIRKALESS